ncbi:MAG: hypothetical protein WCK96_13595 [Methylococcales bacterium]
MKNFYLTLASSAIFTYFASQRFAGLLLIAVTPVLSNLHGACGMWDDIQERFVMATNPRFRYAPSGLLAEY